MRPVALMLVLVTASATAENLPQDAGTEANGTRARQTFQELRDRFQTNEQVAADVTPDERQMLLSGIICDATDETANARGVIRHERAKGASGSVDVQLVQSQQVVINQQQARISRARQKLGHQKLTPCANAQMHSVVDCIRSRVGPVNATSQDCRIPGFWKYRLALMALDPQFWDALFPGNAKP